MGTRHLRAEVLCLALCRTGSSRLPRGGNAWRTRCDLEATCQRGQRDGEDEVTGTKSDFTGGLWVLHYGLTATGEGRKGRRANNPPAFRSSAGKMVPERLEKQFPASFAKTFVLALTLKCGYTGPFFLPQA